MKSLKYLAVAASLSFMSLYAEEESDLSEATVEVVVAEVDDEDISVETASLEESDAPEVMQTASSTNPGQARQRKKVTASTPMSTSRVSKKEKKQTEEDRNNPVPYRDPYDKD